MDDSKPVDLTDKKTEAIRLASEGTTITKIRKALNISNDQLTKMMSEDAVFAENFARARHDGLEELADDLITIPEDMADVQRAKLKSENIRWLLSKRKPMTYGDRLDLNVNHTVDVSTALSEARARIAKQINTIQIENRPLKEIDALKTETDSKSVDVTIPAKKLDIFD